MPFRPVRLNRTSTSHISITQEVPLTKLMPFVVRTVGFGVILGTTLTACRLGMLEDRKVRSGQRGKQQHRPEIYSQRERLKEHAAEDGRQPLLEPPKGGSTLAKDYDTREQGHQTLLQPQDSLGHAQQSQENEESHLLRQPQHKEDWVVIGTDAVWFRLVAAGSAARQNRCLSPPCGEVCTLHHW